MILLALPASKYQISPLPNTAGTLPQLPAIKYVAGSFMGKPNEFSLGYFFLESTNDFTVTFSFEEDICEEFKYPRLIEVTPDKCLVTGLMIWQGVEYLGIFEFRMIIPPGYTKFTV